MISDTHAGSSVALSPRHRLDDGGYYDPSPIQKKIFKLWLNFWDWTYDRLGKEPFIIVHNGDLIDGQHHHTTALTTGNLTIQQRVAMEIMEPHIARSEGYYQIRGTEAHAGKSASEEEMAAQVLGAIPDKETGQSARWEMWIEFGSELIHFAHHIGTTTSAAYESSALNREIVAAFVEAGQFNQRPPSIIVRSHRHRFIAIEPVMGRGIITPGWQAKTPFVFRIDRMRAPMFGGIIIKKGTEGVHIRKKIYTLDRGESVVI